MSRQPEDFENDLVDGIAQLLVAAGVAQYSPAAEYADNVTGITMQKLPATPDNAIAITPYPVSDDPTQSDSIIGLQIRARTGGTDPRTTNALDAAVFNQLQGLQGVTLASGIKIEACTRRSGAMNGQDANSRWERLSNYYLKVWRPSLHRI